MRHLTAVALAMLLGAPAFGAGVSGGGTKTTDSKGDPDTSVGDQGTDGKDQLPAASSGRCLRNDHALRVAGRDACIRAGGAWLTHEAQAKPVRGKRSDKTP